MEIQLAGETEQTAFGNLIGACLLEIAPAGIVIYLRGDLGAGKTTLTRGMLRGLGWEGAVKSPTYTLMEPYEFGELPFYHFDLYRLSDPEELEFLGLRDLAGRGVLAFEWPEKGGGELPSADLLISIAHVSGQRRLSLEAMSEIAVSLIQCLKDKSGK